MHKNVNSLKLNKILKISGKKERSFSNILVIDKKVIVAIRGVAWGVALPQPHHLEILFKKNSLSITF